MRIKVFIASIIILSFLWLLSLPGAMGWEETDNRNLLSVISHYVLSAIIFIGWKIPGIHELNFFISVFISICIDAFIIMLLFTLYKRLK